MRPLRRKVSLNKRRYQENGFDLDLTYITGNVIAMGYPSVGFESIYRNPRSEVKEFFDKYHKDKYKVYNLCIESSRQYDVNEFYTRVANYPFADHQAPPLTMMGELCSDVEKWLAADEKNVAAIHCKAGKGRAGMMICCYLLHSKFAKTASEAMTYYAEKRTKNGEGVTIPSQRRYINYYEKILKYGMPEQPSIKLNSITISTSKYILHKGASEPWVEVLARGKDRVFNSPAVRAGSEDAVIDLRDLEIKGDYKVIIYDKAFDKKEVCHFWFNTAFVHENKLVIQKPDLDKIWKDCKKNKKFQQDFFVELSFKDSKISAMNKLIRNKKRNAQKKKSQAKKKPVKKTDSSEESSSESESSESESETSESESEDDKKKKAPKKAVARKKKQESSEEESSESESESESEDEPKKSNNNNNKKSETKKEEPKKVDSKKEDPKKKDSKKEEPKKQDSKKDVKKEEPKKQDSKKDVKKEDPKKKDSKKDVKKEEPKKVEEPKKEEPKKEEPKKEEPKPIIKEPTPQAPVTSNEKAEESSSDSESDSSDSSSSSSSADSIVRRSRNNTPKEPPQNSHTPAPAPSPAPTVVPVTHQASTDSSSSSDSSGPELQPVVVAPKSEPPKEAPKPAKRAPEDESTDSSSSEDSSDSESD